MTEWPYPGPTRGSKRWKKAMKELHGPRYPSTAQQQLEGRWSRKDKGPLVTIYYVPAEVSNLLES